MNHGFFNTTQKGNANPCTGRAPVHRGERKHGRANPNLSSDDIFFDIRGIVHVDWVPEGQTVHKVYYKEVLTDLREQMRRRHEMWKTLLMGSSRHCAGTQRLVCQDFLTKHKITVLEHPPYSLDLVPRDFLFCFQRSSLR